MVARARADGSGVMCEQNVGSRLGADHPRAWTIGTQPQPGSGLERALERQRFLRPAREEPEAPGGGLGLLLVNQ